MCSVVLRGALSRAFPVLQLPALKALPGFSGLKFCSRGFLGNLCSTVTKCWHIFRLRPQNRTQRCFLLRKKVSLETWNSWNRGNKAQAVKVVQFSPRIAVSITPTAGSDGWSLALFPLQIANPSPARPDSRQQLLPFLGLHPSFLCFQPGFFTLLMCMYNANVKLRAKWGQGFALLHAVRHTRLA